MKCKRVLTVLDNYEHGRHRLNYETFQCAQIDAHQAVAAEMYAIQATNQSRQRTDRLRATVALIDGTLRWVLQIDCLQLGYHQLGLLFDVIAAHEQVNGNCESRQCEHTAHDHAPYVLEFGLQNEEKTIDELDHALEAHQIHHSPVAAIDFVHEQGQLCYVRLELGQIVDLDRARAARAPLNCGRMSVENIRHQLVVHHVVVVLSSSPSSLRLKIRPEIFGIGQLQAICLYTSATTTAAAAALRSQQ